MPKKMAYALIQNASNGLFFVFIFYLGRPKSGITGNAESGGSVTVGGGASGRGLPRHPSTRQPTPASLEEHKKLRVRTDSSSNILR